MILVKLSLYIMAVGFSVESLPSETRHQTALPDGPVREPKPKSGRKCHCFGYRVAHGGFWQGGAYPALVNRFYCEPEKLIAQRHGTAYFLKADGKLNNVPELYLYDGTHWNLQWWKLGCRYEIDRYLFELVKDDAGNYVLWSPLKQKWVRHWTDPRIRIATGDTGRDMMYTDDPEPEDRTWQYMRICSNKITLNDTDTGVYRCDPNP